MSRARAWVYVMWLCVLLALAVFHEAECLHEIRPFNVDSSAISNIELLIPLALPVSRHQRVDRARSVDRQEEVSDKRRDHDEPYSSIPSYAFTLGTKSAKPRASEKTSPLPKFVKNRSLYIAKLWPRYNGQIKKTAHAASKDACHELLRKQPSFAGNSLELLLYICNELMDVLATRCGCCGDNQSEERALPRIEKSSLSLPWLNGRREMDERDDIQQ